MADPIIKCDVLVVGGGAAGIAASVAAARSDCKVVLLERYGFFGGLATSASVGTVCGLYLRGRAEHVCGGFAVEWAGELSRRSGSSPVGVADGLHVLPYDVWSFKRTADAFLKMTGIESILHGTMFSVETGRGRVKEVGALVWNRKVIIRPACVVDCTGEATVLCLAGGRVDESGGQSAAVACLLEDPGAPTLALMRDIMRAVEEGRISQACGAVSFVPAPEKGVYMKVNMPCDVSGWNRLTELEQRSREILDELFGVIPGKGARTPVQVGIRSGRRAVGKAVLTAADVLECRKFSDGIACGAWPVEEWGEGLQPSMTYMSEGGYYEIPAGCLISDDLDNVFVAGRCISAEHKAIASARVIGTALSTGWAAGKAAAFQSKNRPLSLAVKEIREDQVRGLI